MGVATLLNSVRRVGTTSLRQRHRQSRIEASTYCTPASIPASFEYRTRVCCKKILCCLLSLKRFVFVVSVVLSDGLREDWMWGCVCDVNIGVFFVVFTRFVLHFCLLRTIGPVSVVALLRSMDIFKFIACYQFRVIKIVYTIWLLIIVIMTDVECSM